nr:MAG TPA: hypothetical protein [Caudoviricetes sp.]
MRATTSTTTFLLILLFRFRRRECGFKRCENFSADLLISLSFSEG